MPRRRPCRSVALRRSGKPVQSASVRSLVENRFEVAAIVDIAAERRIGHLRRTDEIAPAHRDRIETHLAGRFVDQALHHIGRFGLSRAAIGTQLRRVRERRAHHAVNNRHMIDVRIADPRIVGRHAPGQAEIGADIDRDGRTECERPSIAIERKLGVSDLMARMHVGTQRFAAIRGPFHRPFQLPRRPGDQHFLREDMVLHAKGAADIRRPDPDARFGDAEDGADDLAHAKWILRARAHREAAVEGIVISHGRTRFHGVRAGARIVDRQLCHMHRGGELRFGRPAITEFDLEAEIAGRFVPDRRRVGCDRIRQRYGAQRLVADIEQLGCVLRLAQRLGHDERHAISHMPRPIAHQDRLARTMGGTARRQPRK